MLAPGTAMGLAWTPFGGELLYIEVRASTRVLRLSVMLCGLCVCVCFVFGPFGSLPVAARSDIAAAHTRGVYLPACMRLREQ